MLQPSHCDPRPSGYSIWPGPCRCPDNQVYFTLKKVSKIIQSVLRRSDRLSEGYTMSREDGWFDFMVNGGGAVTLQFGKSPFPPRVETLFAPWNEVKLVTVNYIIHFSLIQGDCHGACGDVHDKASTFCGGRQL